MFVDYIYLRAKKEQINIIENAGTQNQTELRNFGKIYKI